MYIDGNLVDKNNYTSESGSTIITLKLSYLNKLSVGEHTLKVAFKDGAEVETKFTIKKVKVPEATTNPKTFDNITVYIALAIISVVGLETIAFVRKRN